MNIKYVHTNLVSKDWKKLALFYKTVFGCTEKPPERNLDGVWLDQATSLSNAHIEGIHLYLPGFDNDGPTLEIFQYNDLDNENSKRPNTSGYGHIAFLVDDVDGCIKRILENKGGLIGKIVDTEIKGVGNICFAYAHDPEGNIIEIQKWN
jgi:lactoylglutathione lyase